MLTLVKSAPWLMEGPFMSYLGVGTDFHLTMLHSRNKLKCLHTKVDMRTSFMVSGGSLHDVGLMLQVIGCYNSTDIKKEGKITRLKLIADQILLLDIL